MHQLSVKTLHDPAGSVGHDGLLHAGPALTVSLVGTPKNEP